MHSKATAATLVTSLRPLRGTAAVRAKPTVECPTSPVGLHHRRWRRHSFSSEPIPEGDALLPRSANSGGIGEPPEDERLPSWSLFSIQPIYRTHGACLDSLVPGNTSMVQSGTGCSNEKDPLDRLSVAGVILGALLLLTIVLSSRFEPSLTIIDVGSLVLTCRFWYIARLGRMRAPALQRLAGFTALTLATGGAFRLAATAEAMETARVALVLVVSAMVLTSQADFLSLGAIAGSLWILAASATLQPDQFWAAAVVLVLTGLGAWFGAGRWGYRKSTPEDAEGGQPESGEEHAGPNPPQHPFHGSCLGYWYWDLGADRFLASKQWASDLKCDHTALTGRPEDWFGRIHPYHLSEVRRRLWSHLGGDADRFVCEYRVRHGDGSYHWAMVKATAQRDGTGQAFAIAGVQIDLSAIVTRDLSMLDDALKDKLTGLPNRRDLTARLEQCLELYHGDPSALFAVAFLDLDRFKFLNDSLGHAVGDKVLAAVADRLRACRREGDVVARFGGDKFVALLDNLQDSREALQIVRRFRAALSSPFQIDGQDLSCSVSIGVALCSSSIKNADDLIRNADAAVNHAKSTHRGEVLFTPDLLSSVTQLWQLQNDLTSAIERNEFVLYYQPIFSLATGKIVSAEALIRWKRHNALVSPAVFIPVAEDMGLIESIGAWALREGCLQNAIWRRRDWSPIKVSVNVSSKQLQLPDFTGLVCDTLAETGLPGEALVLELTETALVESFEQTPAFLSRLRQLGVEVALDDFGTGYSSLSYLRRLDFQTLKLDRSFVEGVVDDPKTAALAQGLIALAHNLGLRVTGEGVETTAQLDFLRRHSCDHLQGYLASRPLVVEAFERMLHSNASLYDLIGAPSNAPPASVRRE